MFWRGGVVLAVLVAAGSAASQSLNQGGSPRVLHSTAEVPPCRSDPHAGVHDPTRLKVLEACATFVGTVIRAPKLNPSDGDVTFNVAPDSAYASMLNGKNRSEGGSTSKSCRLTSQAVRPVSPYEVPKAISVSARAQMSSSRRSELAFA